MLTVKDLFKYVLDNLQKSYEYIKFNLEHLDFGRSILF